MQHKDNETYQERRCADQPAQQCSPQQTIDGTTYSVTCPTCAGNFSVEEPNSTYRLRRSDKEALAPRPVPVVCECGFAHPGRPSEEAVVGCGSAWQLTQ